MESLRELTDTELESVSGGATATSAGGPIGAAARSSQAQVVNAVLTAFSGLAEAQAAGGSIPIITPPFESQA
jgi:bacteriocin-like protein